MISENISIMPGILESSIYGLNEPTMTVGIIDGQVEVSGCLNGNFYGDGFGPVSGIFSAKATSGNIVLTGDNNREIACASAIRLIADKDSTFTLFQVTIGKQFHWERKENQTFQGNLILKYRDGGTIAAIDEIPLEDYLKSVVSSEMSSNAPMEFLKAHAIISRSWLIAALDRKRKTKKVFVAEPGTKDSHGQAPDNLFSSHNEITRWYEQEDHDLYDVCADDHCQRYQGVTKIASAHAGESVLETCGLAIIYRGEICDARYSKACGGITEAFETAWSDNQVPYLASISDATTTCLPIVTEEDAARWILSEPNAYCNTEDANILTKVLPDFDQETKAFFRWKIEYTREELEEILLEKSGIDFGTLKEIQPLSRGPSGRIFRLRIIGSKKSMVVGKELEIRRWLSRSHLYSSAFIVTMEYDTHGEVKTFVFHGAGWGHGVGLCQIGAAVMATQGFSAEEILRHYFPGTEIQRIY
ncbi:MAG: SpoIID/LytB domain-containing protein [Proteobacteria bacterium]|nr:SpoIID/LytB domain-containing protein [Pseudomonadota bacterium]